MIASQPQETERAAVRVENPATGGVIGHVPDLSTTEVAGIVASARAAQSGWAELGFDGRGELMRKLRGWLLANREKLLCTIMAEGGRTREDVLIGELFYICEALGFWSAHAHRYLAERRVRRRSLLMLGRAASARHLPYGVVGVIAPWNFPLALGVGDAIPALMAGNVVVLKPSSVTPLSSVLVERGWREIGAPSNVFRVATGGAQTGAALIDEVDMLTFTGSVQTGKRIMAQASERLIPISLELGGKDPMIVLADADLKRAARMAVQYAFWNSGQICQAVERVYVDEQVYGAFVAEVVAQTARLRQGAAGPSGSAEVGAMAFPPQLETVDRHVRDAVAKGARVAIGGARRTGLGSFYEPTVLVDVDHSMEVMTEETFGPLLPIMAVRGETEAVTLANDSAYGLNSSVFTRDPAAGRRVACALEVGNTCINDVMVNSGMLAAPFASAKLSGLGIRNGPAGIQKYCRVHTILVTSRLVSRFDPLAWPNRAGRTKAIEYLMALAWGQR